MNAEVYYQTEPTFRGYVPGNKLLHVGTAKLATPPTDEAGMRLVCERLFAMLNDDRPAGRRVRSMSVGDVVVLGELAYGCEPLGWARVNVPADDLIDAQPVLMHLTLEAL